jgi:hypothetical protein
MKRADLIEQLRQLKAAYQVALSAASGELVLRDLRKFCRADYSCFDADPRVHAVYEGRREVWLRINDLLTLSPEELANFIAPERRPGVTDDEN